MPVSKSCSKAALNHNLGESQITMTSVWLKTQDEFCLPMQVSNTFHFQFHFFTSTVFWMLQFLPLCYLSSLALCLIIYGDLLTCSYGGDNLANGVPWCMRTPKTRNYKRGEMVWEGWERADCLMVFNVYGPRILARVPFFHSPVEYNMSLSVSLSAFKWRWQVWLNTPFYPTTRLRKTITIIQVSVKRTALQEGWLYQHYWT